MRGTIADRTVKIFTLLPFIAVIVAIDHMKEQQR